jgi:hypothetical protein
MDKLREVLETYAFVRYEHHGADLVALLEHAGHVTRGHQHLVELVRHLLTEGAKAAVVRNDVPPAELASFCIHALAAAAGSPSKTAVRRLVDVTLAGVRP